MEKVYRRRVVLNLRERERETYVVSRSKCEGCVELWW